MALPLAEHLKILDRRLSAILLYFDRFATKRMSTRRVEKHFIQEGILSAAWQTWCGFCRNVIVDSTLGSTTSNGIQTNSALQLNSSEEVAWVAHRASRRNAVAPIRALSGMHLEPTWGDPTKINLIVAAIQTNNAQQLLTGLLGPGPRSEHLQKTRNACAHISADTLREIRNLQVFYSDNGFLHPSDAIFWTDPATGDFALRTWIESFLVGAELAIK